jgi:hypothetical protein
LKKKLKKIGGKMTWYSDAAVDESISLFAGLLANPDVPLKHVLLQKEQDSQEFNQNGLVPHSTT